MYAEIRMLLNNVKREELILLKEVEKMKNSSESCCCPNRQPYDFKNSIDDGDGTILCLNCGGRVDPNEMEMT